jgi:putative DNA primase/helicase
MKRRDIQPPRQLLTNDKDRRSHRANVEARDQAARYRLYLDGWPAGGFENFKDGLGWENWSFDPGRELKAAEREKREQAQAKFVKDKEEAEAERQCSLEHTAATAQRICRIFGPAAKHPYLEAKNIKPHGVLATRDGALLVPLRDGDGVIRNVQRIYEDGHKLFLTGAFAPGLRFVIPAAEGTPDDAPTFVCEGFATGATIAEATGCRVICAITGGNLLAVARSVAAEGRKTVIAIDDDWRNEKATRPSNIGLVKGLAAARAVNALVVVPIFGPGRKPKDSDFNDLAAFRGSLEGLNGAR